MKNPNTTINPIPSLATAGDMDIPATAPAPKPSKVEPPCDTVFVVMIKSNKGTWHPVLNPTLGRNALATFATEDIADRTARQDPVCNQHHFIVVPLS